MLLKNNKMFQRVVIVFPWDYQTYCKLWPRKDRVTEEQNPIFSKIFFFQFKLIILQDKQECLISVSLNPFSNMFYLPSQDWNQSHRLFHKRLHLLSIQILVATVPQTKVYGIKLLFHCLPQIKLCSKMILCYTLLSPTWHSRYP